MKVSFADSIYRHRLGYDVGGGYDREMGGRLQYGNDRPGRFMGRGPPGKYLSI